jgi:hypothetical protein
MAQVLIALLAGTLGVIYTIVIWHSDRVQQERREALIRIGFRARKMPDTDTSAKRDELEAIWR